MKYKLLFLSSLLVLQSAACGEVSSGSSSEPSTAESLQLNTTVSGITTTANEQGQIFALPGTDIQIEGLVTTQTTSNSQGQFVLKNIPAGKHFLFAKKVDAKGQFRVTRQPIEVISGQNLNLSNVLLVAPVSLKGQILLDDNNTILDNFSISLSNTTHQTFTNKEGKFLLENIAPGEYNLLINHRNYKKHTQSVNLTSSTFLPPTTLSKHTRESNQSNYTFSGKVSSIEKIPIPGVFIQFISEPFVSQSDLSGQFEIGNIPVGTYQVNFSHPQFKPEVQTVIISKNTEGKITLRPDELALPGEVRIHVKDDQGNRVANSEVSLLPSQYIQSTNFLGDVFFDRVQPGTYEVSIFKSGFAEAKKQVNIQSASRLNLEFALTKPVPTPIPPSPTPTPTPIPSPQGFQPTIVTIEVSSDKNQILNDNLSISVGRTIQLYSFLEIALGNNSIIDRSGKNVFWDSSDKTIASVGPDGLVSGNAQGAVKITITSKADPKSTASIIIGVI